MTMTSPMQRSTEAQLVAQLRAGDQNAYAVVVNQYGPQLLAVASRFFHGPQDRDDAVQDAFISAFKAIGSFDGDSKLATWLHRITVNACLMKLRSRSRRPETSIDEMLPQFDNTGHHVKSVAYWDQDGYERLARDEARSQVRACIDQLPESYRTVLLLRDIEGLSTEEAAQQLGCTEANVKTRLHRARLALRGLLEPHVRNL